VKKGQLPRVLKSFAFVVRCGQRVGQTQAPWRRRDSRMGRDAADGLGPARTAGSWLEDWTCVSARAEEENDTAMVECFHGDE